MKIDLHNHTNHSDGLYTPKELLDRAIKNNVDIFAITDHDSVLGCEEILNLSKNLNVKVILGMELSTYYEGESVHIVCLFKENVVPERMYDFSKEIVLKREKRAIEMMQKLKDIYNINYDIDSLLNEKGVITRANMCRHILEKNPNISKEEASFMVSPKSKGFIPSTKMSVPDGLKLAKEAGCVTILAHPCLLKEENVEKVLQFGFDGMEVRYPSIKNDEEKLTQLANKYNIFISAGSDCHGDNTHADIGTCTLNEEEFKPILDKLEIKEMI